MAKLRIAVAGAGLIGLRHLEEIVASAECVIGGIVDPGPKAADVAARFRVPLYPTLGECLATKPDGVIVATPNALHVEQALQCVVAGIPVLVEKPLAHTVEAGDALVATAEKAGVPILVGHMRRHSPIMDTAIDVVRSGRLGKLVAVMGSAVFCKPAVDGYFDPPNDWRRRPGGGPILINLIHEVDALRSLMGEIVAVQAQASNATRGFEVEDTVAITLRFAGGALGTFMLSDTAASPRSWEQTSQENKAYATYDDEDTYVVMGTHGSLAIPTMRLRTYASDADRSWFKPFVSSVVPMTRADPLALQIAHFADVIRGRAQPLVTGRDGLMNLRVVDAIARAAKRGGTVEIAPT
ncbi:MAG: Gfo/Idh/MocA family oxidoreductase [Burkholderiales bacterium]|nr:Gfo/Idh/MocA family oxidoreductase [Burkholderiales bacterium]